MDSFRSDNYNPLIDDPGFEMDIIAASSLGNFNHVAQLIEHGADVNACNAKGWSSLMYACHYGHFTVVKILVEAGCDVNHADFAFKRTALMLAASNGHTRCIEQLIHSGRLDLNLKDKDGHTAADLAISHGHGENKVIAAMLKIPRRTGKPVTDTSLTPLRRVGNRLVRVNGKPVSPDDTSFSSPSHLFTYQMTPSAPVKKTSGGKNFLLNVPSSFCGQRRGRKDLQQRLPEVSTPDSRGTQLDLNWSFSPFNLKSCPSSPAPEETKALPSTMDELLDRIGLSIYKDLFGNNQIDLYTFADLTDNDLIYLGISSFGHRRKLHVAQLRLLESVEIKSTQEALFADWLLIERSRLQEENNRLKAFMMEWRELVHNSLALVAANIRAAAGTEKASASTQVVAEPDIQVI